MNSKGIPVSVAPQTNVTGLDLLFSSYDDGGESEEDSLHRAYDVVNETKHKTNSHEESPAKDHKRLKLQPASSTDVNENVRLHLLPVPDILKDMYSLIQVNSNDDDPEAHQGRVRSFPHVRGNWASYVHINFSENEGIIALVRMLVSYVKVLNAPSEVHINSDCHLSLTRTQIFRHHWIDPFIYSLKSKLKSYSLFDVVFDTVEVYLNEEKTRTFIGLNAFISTNLLRLVQDCDSCLSDYELMPYYDEPSFHVSYGWMVGNHESWVRESLLPVLHSKWEDLCNEEPTLKTSLVEYISFKTGNRNMQFPLQAV